MKWISYTYTYTYSRSPLDLYPTPCPYPYLGHHRALSWGLCLWLKKEKRKLLVAESCPTLCDLMDCSLPGSSVHGILQARTLEWAAIPFSRRSTWLRDRTWVQADSLPSEPPGEPPTFEYLYSITYRQPASGNHKFGLFYYESVCLFLKDNWPTPLCWFLVHNHDLIVLYSSKWSSWV